MKARYFVILALIALIVGLFGLRQNALGAAALLDKLAVADQGAAPTAQPLADLQQYVSQHMGASISFELTSSYNRDVAAAQTAASGAQAQGNVYSAAQAACASKADSIVQANCVSAYVSAHSTPGSQPTVPVLPQRSSYQHNLKAPFFSADLAGIGIGLAALSTIAALITLIIKKF